MGGIAAARTALAEGRWAQAEDALAAEGSTVERAEILAETRWWHGCVSDSIALWEEGFRLASDGSDWDRAARLAGWIACEYAALGNPAAASGWWARGDTLPASASRGWLELARGMAASDPAEQEARSGAALAEGRRLGDHDLEIAALGRLGLARIRSGSFGEGLACFDEAMAAATGGEASRLRTVGEVCCDLVLATELTGDVQRFARWLSVVEDFVDRRGYPPVMGFCATCCAEADSIQGDFGGAEQQLRAAVVSLHETGHAARCVPPTAKLADLLVLQGRLEEADQLVAGDDGGDALIARARLALARGDIELARVLAARAGRRIGGDTLVKIAALSVLVDAHLSAHDRDAAAVASATLDALAVASTSARAQARAAIARGRIALDGDDHATAAAHFEQALDHLAGVHGSIEGADAHLELARLHLTDAPDVARAEANAALAAFEAVGATRCVDEAAALLRRLGDRRRVGQKGLATLTQREYEVLRLVAHGLTNTEIAERLYISAKTAGNHVSSILSKLHLRSRAEAAAYAALHPDRP